MIIIYTIINLLIIGYSKSIFNSIFNPVSVYAVVWGVAVFFHECGLIYYFELTMFTWSIIIGMQIIFSVFCILGSEIQFSPHKNIVNNDIVAREKLAKYIIICIFLSGFSIMVNLYHVIEVYGFMLIGAISDIYFDRVNQTQEIEMVPYLGAFLPVAMSLLGIYVKKFGFTYLLGVAFLLSFLNALTSGGRAGIVFSMLIFINSYLLTHKKKEFNKKSFFGAITRKRILIILAIAAFAIMILSISVQRVLGANTYYATLLFYNIFGVDNVLAYKIISYIGAPIGALNEYLYTCEFSFGKNTFLILFNLMHRLGFMDKVAQYQAFYMTPIPCNVATWLRELIQDFTIIGAVIVVGFWGVWISYIFTKSKNNQGMRFTSVGAIMLMVTELSFFDWKMRSTEIWIALFFAYLIARRIDLLILNKKSKSS